MMVSEDKQVKTEIASKNEAAPEKTNTGLEQSKGEGSKAATSPSAYSRGEGQKPVSKVYRENWNAIFAKKEK